MTLNDVQLDKETLSFSLKLAVTLKKEVKKHAN